MRLPVGLRIPTPDASCAGLEPSFFGVTMFDAAYAAKATRLLRSCLRVGVCCGAAQLPPAAFDATGSNDSVFERHRLIASKPLFLRAVLRANTRPLLWLDADMEFVRFPSLLASPRSDGATAAWANVDAVFFNWVVGTGDKPVGWVSPRGRQRPDWWKGKADDTMMLRPASGVAFINQTSAAARLLLAWAEAMAYDKNARAPDDRTLEQIFNYDGWDTRATVGWLPRSYLCLGVDGEDLLAMPLDDAMLPSRSQDDELAVAAGPAARCTASNVVLLHDRGHPPNEHGLQSRVMPVVPPHCGGTLPHEDPCPAEPSR